MSKHALQQPAASLARQQPRALHGADRPRHGWRTVNELAVELRFPSAKACRSWLSREHVACVKRGRVILVSSVDVERKLRAVNA